MYRIKSTKYNTYFSGGRRVENPDFVEDIPQPKESWGENKAGWEKYYNKVRERNQKYIDALAKQDIEPDDVATRMELMKKYNVPHDYMQFQEEPGKLFETRRGAEQRLSSLTKTTKKIRSSKTSQVLFGNELSVRYKIYKVTLVDNEA